MKNKTILMIMIITIFFTGCSKTKNNELLHEGKIALEKHDYTNAYTILECERKKSIAFLKNALDIKTRKENNEN